MKSKKIIAYYILGMIFGVPAMAPLSMLIGKHLGFFENSSIGSIIKDYIVACIGISGLVGVVFFSIGLLALKDRAMATISKHRDQRQHATE